MAHLDTVGVVNKHSLPKPKRVIDREFEKWYLSRGGDIHQIETWRNASFTGVEAYTAFAKYNHPEPKLDDVSARAFRQATNWMSMQFSPYMSDSELLSAEAVINGTDGSGSPGFPWNTIHRKCDDFYDSEDASHLGKYWDKCDTCEGAFCIWNSFLKEELRKQTKIDAGDIRQINGCPVEFKVAMNRFCLDANNRFYRAHLNTASAVGINKFRGGWNQLYKKLNRFPTGFALDVKRWDSHFPRMLFKAICQLRFDCLQPEFQTELNWNKLSSLYEQIICSATVLSWGEVIATRLGNPSGSPNTVVDNTLGLYALISYCWIRSCQEAGRETDYADFNRQVVLALYGDDNTFTASEEGLELLKPAQVKRFAIELGFQVTADADEPMPVLELDFLSSKFVQLKNGFVVWRPKDPEKAKASLAFRSDGNVLTSWSRACAHRINSFFEKSVFKTADDYCKHLLHKLDIVYGDDPEWVAAKPQYLSLRRIHNLYTQKEAGLSDGLH